MDSPSSKKLCISCRAPVYIAEYVECRSCRQLTHAIRMVEHRKAVGEQNKALLEKCLVGNNPVDWSKFYV